MVFVPEDTTFLVYPVTFTGPCKAEEIHFVVMKKLYILERERERERESTTYFWRIIDS